MLVGVEEGEGLIFKMRLAFILESLLSFQYRCKESKNCISEQSRF